MRRVVDWMRQGRGWRSFSVLFGILFCLAQASAQAKPQPTQSSTSAPQSDSVSIVAESAPYRIEWDGTHGTFLRRALGQEPEQKMDLVYLHSDPGPKGYAKHLAWFLAREPQGFSLLWCYLNDNGREFVCWLYSYPGNHLTTVRFVGDYRFTPPAEPRPATPTDFTTLNYRPLYTGPDFSYRDWTRRAGVLKTLELRPAQTETSPATQIPAAPPALTLKNLLAQPLHQISVGPANGWRTGGWSELHAFATDSTGSPYYLILYSNSTRGFVVDLKRAQTYVTDFGEKVRFGSAASAFGASRSSVTDTGLELTVPRHTVHEVTLLSTQTYANPYTDVLLEANLRAPNGDQRTFLGFWDGTNTWRFRFTPDQVGTWTWTTRSNDSELDKQTGTFECVRETNLEHGFLVVHPSPSYRRHFAYQDTTPFLPVLLQDPVHHFPAGPPATAQNDGVRTAALTGQTGDKPAVPPSFILFQKRVDACAALGVNRFIGGYLLDKPGFANKNQANEGGAPFLDYDLDRLNPAYFQWMDKRIAYCNEKGIVPDIGLGWIDQDLFTTYSDSQLRRLWRYALARYASANVCWNLFGKSSGTLSSDTVYIADFAKLTRNYDPYNHPITTVTQDNPQPPTVKQTSDTTAKSNAQNTNDGAGTSTTNQASAPPLSRKRKAQIEAENARRNETPLVRVKWLDVITLAGDDPNVVAKNYIVGKPIVQLAPVLSDAEVSRRLLWETRMRGGYWASAPVTPGGQTALTAPETKAALDSARFFASTRFWRLEPHPEMLGKPEDPAAARRRRAAEMLEKQKENTESAPNSKIPPKSPGANQVQAPIYALIDPGWEYVLYFTQGGAVTLDLIEATGTLRVVWFNPRTGQSQDETKLMGGTYATFNAPDGKDWVLYITRR